MFPYKNLLLKLPVVNNPKLISDSLAASVQALFNTLMLFMKKYTIHVIENEREKERERRETVYVLTLLSL